MKSRRATGKHDAGAPEDANGYEYDATTTSCRTITGNKPNPNAAATATNTAVDATATELWVWDANATAIFRHGPAGAKHASNVQHGTDGPYMAHTRRHGVRCYGHGAMVGALVVAGGTIVVAAEVVSAAPTVVVVIK